MSQSKLKYCCSNPECRHKFTIDEALTSDDIIQVHIPGSHKGKFLGVPLVHIVCPKCDTIAATMHLPADPI